MADKYLGWQGMRMKIPNEWDLGKVEGGTRGGYLRTDDLKMQRMELRWTTSKSRYPVNTLIDKYLKRFSSKISDVDRKFIIYKKGKAFNGETEIFLTKSASDDSIFMVRRCDDCQRIVFMRIIFERGLYDVDLATRIFNSFEDHNDSGEYLWSVFDLRIYLDKNWLMRKSIFLAGKIVLNFCYEKKDDRFNRNDTLNIERISMADYVLREKDLADWFVKDYLKNRISKKAEKKEMDSGKHRTVSFTEKEKGLLLSSCIYSYVWKCDTENKIFVVRVFSRRNTDASYILKGVRCHGDIQ